MFEYIVNTVLLPHATLVIEGKTIFYGVCQKLDCLAKPVCVSLVLVSTTDGSTAYAPSVLYVLI